MKRRSRYARGKQALSEQAELDLLLGPGVGAFATDEERREAWFLHRDSILSLDPVPHALIDYELNGFLPGERILAAAERLRASGVLPLTTTEKPRKRKQP